MAEFVMKSLTDEYELSEQLLTWGYGNPIHKELRKFLKLTIPLRFIKTIT